ncbi:tyrosine-type recombinase/integrase [Anaerobaca lacustris]|uniref:Site-specific integrase n=1 Tax=Anaerobaca lacustris TaxID=3044600 RepID=A0AAW6TXB2_9BACT|nr:site-specific integrase [Sedimentisphaerales bacterium M17dextr]
MTLPTFDEIRRQEPRTDLTAMPGGLLPEPKERRSLPTFEEIRAGRSVMTPADGPKEATLADIPDADLPESIRDQGSRVRNAEFYAEQFGLQGLSIDDAYDYEPQLNELIWGPGVTTESANAKIAAYRKQAVEQSKSLFQELGSAFRETVEARGEIWEAAEMTVWGTGPYGEESVVKAWRDVLKYNLLRLTSLRGLITWPRPEGGTPYGAEDTMQMRWSKPEKTAKEELTETVEGLPGLAEAVVPAGTETLETLIDFAFVYPKLFQLAGVPAKAIGKIPRVQKAIKALGGTEWVTGHERALIYRLALQVGLRSSEIARLRVLAFDFDANPPSVRIESSDTKGKRAADLVLMAETAEAIREFLKDKAATDKAFAMPHKSNVADMLRGDLEAAEIPYTDAAGRDMDFHSLRHSFITHLALAGVHPAVAQKLARHRSIELTMRCYTHVFHKSECEAIDSLKRFTSASLSDARRLSSADLGGHKTGDSRSETRLSA